MATRRSRTTGRSSKGVVSLNMKGVEGRRSARHYKGKQIRDDYYLSQKALWRLRNMLEATGLKVPDKAFRLPLKQLIGKELAITIEDDEFDKKLRSRVTDTFPVAEFEANLMEEDEEEEEGDEEVEDEEEDEEVEDEEEEGDEDEEVDEDEEDEDEELEEIDLEEV